ncbi:MAG: YHYH protein, partial [Flavobacteriales bacterium]|nr:YHYH protein [Flavobacteriales bacterium]
DEPDHKSMYYPQGHALYENYSEPNNPDFNKNPGEIEAQNFVFKIPRFPEEASSKSATTYGAIGVAVNGVVFFNQVAAPGDDILEELNTFDQYEGHPAMTTYHYHIEPTWLTQTVGNDAFMGFLLDGFPVYGPYENGVKLTNDDLDDDHGHTHATEDFPDGIYHYHFTDDLPWINGGNYHGTPGTFTN